MSRIGPCVVAFSAGVASFSQQAVADTQATWMLSWEAPAECPDEAFVREEIESLVAAPGSPGLRSVAARGVVWRDESSEWHARIDTETEGVTGERQLDGSSCREVTGAAILILALSIDPTSGGKRHGGPPETARQSEATPPEPLPVLSSEARPARDAGLETRAPDSRQRSVSLEIGPVVAFGVLPSPAYGFSAGVALHYENWRLRLAAAWWPEKHGSVENEPTKGGDIRLASAESAVGVAWDFGQTAIGPELGLIGGLFHGTGSGVRNPKSGQARWAAGTVGGRVTWNVHDPFALEGRAGAFFRIYRQRFELDDVGIVHEPAAVGMMGALVLIGYFR